MWYAITTPDSGVDVPVSVGIVLLHPETQEQYPKGTLFTFGYTAVAYRGKGYYTQMLQQFLIWFQRNKSLARPLFLTVGVDDLRALHIYEKLGFKKSRILTFGDHKEWLMEFPSKEMVSGVDDKTTTGLPMPYRGPLVMMMAPSSGRSGFGSF
jgi:RimJ/RimL family protein N-acetyltransferase